MSARSLNAGFLSAAQLHALGITDAARRNILVHSTAVIVNFDEIRFGENIRIDPFVVLSCRSLTLGDHVHIATGCGLFGAAPIRLDDFSGLSAQVLIYSSSDDYSGQWLNGPTVPSDLAGVEHAAVEIGRHCLIGAHTTVLPGAVLGEGAAVGSGALVKGKLPAWTLSVGVPAKPIRERARGCLEMEARLRARQANTPDHDDDD